MKNKFLIVFYFLLICLFLSSCSLMWDKNGPYHHEALIEYQSEIISCNDNKYCIMEEKIYLVGEETFIKVNLEKYNDLPVKCIRSYDEKIYVAFANKLVIYDSDFKFDREVIIEGIRSFLLHKNILYYTLNDLFSSFYSYDLLLNKKNIIYEKFVNNIYVVDNKVIFSNGSGNLCFTDNLFNWNLLSGVNKTGIINFPIKEVCLYYNNTLGLLRINEENLEIKINEKTYYLELCSQNFIYPNIRIFDNKLYFSLYVFIENDLCNNRFCFCHYGKSKAYLFDFEKEMFTLIKELESNSYVINVNDKKDIYYYFDSKIYKNNEVVKEVDKIEPYSQYYQYGENFEMDGKTKSSITYFYENNGNIYMKHFDFKNEVKSEYYK